MAENKEKNIRQDIKWLEALIKRYENNREGWEKDFSDRLLRDKIQGNIRPLSLYRKCVETMMQNYEIPHKQYASLLDYAGTVYREVFPYGEVTPGFDELAIIFVDFFTEHSVMINRCFSTSIFNMFNNKHNYVKWMRSLGGRDGLPGILSYCISYGMEARSYYPDEDMFTANLINVTDRMLRDVDAESVYKEAVTDIRHMGGVYDVDEGMILEAEQQLNAAREVIGRSADILAETDKRIQAMDSLSNAAANRVKQVCEVEVGTATAKLQGIGQKLKDEYDAFMDSQKESVLLEKKQLITEITDASEAELSAFRKEARSIVNMAKLELAKLNRESGDVLAKLDSYMADDDKLKSVLNAGEEREALLSKLNRLTVLNDANIKALEAQAETMISEAQISEPGKKKKSGKSAVPGTDATGAATDEDPEEIPPVNPMLDDSIDFRERYEIVMKAKERMEQNGEHFHKMFDDVIMAVMENANPYLIGPSGCGKTYMVSQLAQILGAEFIDIGYINEEYDILGFQTANGGYSRPNFYRCYKYGKIAFCDELDNGNGRATVKLNSFLSNVRGAGYNFPNGEHVKRHENFRIIAAGNTSGNGADSVYNTREKIEESVQQRFTPIYIGYDNAVEKAILRDADDWYEFIVLFRAATDEWSRKSHSVAPGIITTRDASRIRRYLDNGSFDMSRILDYEFIQTKDESYLAFLSTYIAGHIAANSPAKDIAKSFEAKVKDIREGKTVR